MTLAAAPVHDEPFTFRADRPFLFVIRDTTSGTPLFVGRVANPMM
jgi:serpin B